MRQKRRRDSQARGQRELLLCCDSPPTPPSTYLWHSWPLRHPAMSGGLAFRSSPLLFCALQHLSPQLSLFPVIPYLFNSSSSSFILFWVSVAKMPSNSGEAASSRWRKLGKEHVANKRESPPRPTPSLLRTCNTQERCTQPHTGLAPLQTPPTLDPRDV